MTSLDFDDYDSLLSSLHNNQGDPMLNDTQMQPQPLSQQHIQQQQQQLQQQQLQQQQQQQQQQQMQQMQHLQLQQQQQQLQRPLQNQILVKEEELPSGLNFSNSSLFSHRAFDNNFHNQQQTPNQHSQHNNNNNSNNNDDYLHNGSKFGSVASSSSNFSSEVNFNDFNDALSSLNSGILSPYSGGSSPDDFFLSTTNSNVDSQYSHDNDSDFNSDISEQNNNNNDNNNNNNNNADDVLYPQTFVPVPMAESMSNSTVVFNSHYDNNVSSNPNNSKVPLNTVAEVNEDEIMKSKTKRKPVISSSNHHHNHHNVNNSINDNLLGNSKPGKKIKSSHNLIEKKYRTNINSKIIELRNCVPALRILVAKSRNHRTGSVVGSNSNDNEEQFDDDYEGNGYTDDEEKLDGLKPAKKLNKATILSKATEYIKHLEKKNEILLDQNEKLKHLLESNGSNLDISMLNQQQQLQHHLQQQQNNQLYNDSSFTPSPYNNSNSTSNHGSNLVSPSDPAYPNQNSSQAYPQDHTSLTNKLLLGGMSCMIGASSLDDFSGDSSSARKGLFAIPIFALDSSNSITNFNPTLFRPFLGFIKILLCFAIIYFNFIAPKSNKIDENENENHKLNMSFSYFFNIILNPLKFYGEKSSMSIENCEYQLTNSMYNLNQLSFEFWLSFIRSLNMSSNNKENFLKALHFKRISEYLTIQIQNRNFITTLIFRFLVSIVDKFGLLYWSKTNTENVDGNQDINLHNLLNQDYADFKLSKYFLNGLKTSDRGDLVNILSYGSIDSKINEILRKDVILESLIIESNNKNEISYTTGEYQISLMKNQIYELLENVNDLSKNLNKNIQFKGLILKFFDNPTKRSLNDCYRLLKQKNFTVNYDSKFGYICCVLKYQLIHFNNDYKLLINWLNKLKLSDFANEKNNITFFEFVSLLNVFKLLKSDILNNICQTINEYDVQEEEKFADDESIGNYSLSSRGDITKINSTLLNNLANMRIFIGNSKHEEELGIHSKVKDNLIENILKIMMKLNGDDD